MKTCWTVTWHGSLQYAADLYETAPAWLAKHLEPLLPAGLDASQLGLYLATGSAGAQASVAMWAEAVDAGPGFANPRPFPWTLASSPAGHLAQALGIRGPVVVLVGDAAALLAAADHALCDLAERRVTACLLVALDLPVDASEREAAAAALVLVGEQGGRGAVYQRGGEAEETGSAWPGDLLGAAVTALERGQSVILSSPVEGSLILESA